MSERPQVIPIPVAREPVALMAVDRAVAELRRGRAVAIRAAGGTGFLAQAAEAATAEGLAALQAAALTTPVVALTARRAAVLGLTPGGVRVVRVEADPALSAECVRDLADPFADWPTPPPVPLAATECEAFGGESAAVRLAKTARLLPAALIARIDDPDAGDLEAWAARRDLLVVDAGDVFQYDYTEARTLRPVSEARVPLADAEETRVVAFRPLDGGVEHLAVVIGAPDPGGPVLTRLHSECFTGDLLGSLRCDCGDQLRGAIRAIAEAGGGVLLYLAHEGRGIGLVNKLRAYALQDEGFDTFDANEQLGFDADERVYLPAAQMLRQLGFDRVRLLTNNPTKVDGLAALGVDVVERVPHAFPSNPHNEAYLRTKAGRGGHVL